MNDVLLTIAEVADNLRVRRETVRRFIKEGRLRALVLPGGGYRLREKDVEALLKDSLPTSEADSQ